MNLNEMKTVEDICICLIILFPINNILAFIHTHGEGGETETERDREKLCGREKKAV